MSKKHRMARRAFLKGTGASIAGLSFASLMPIFANLPVYGAAGQKKLLFIFQRGGNDGINTVIPHGDTDYSTSLRPTLYIAPEDAIDLQNGFANYHPSLADLMEVHDAGNLAAIHRVGYQGLTRSHFDGMRIWENGTPQDPKLYEGWIYRFVRENGVSQGASLPVITSQNNPPLLILGDEKFVNIRDPNSFDYDDPDPKRGKYSAAWRRTYADLGGPYLHRAGLSDIGVKLVDTLDAFRSWDHANWNPTHPTTGEYLFPVSDETNPDSPDGGKKFSRSSYRYFRSLKVCALSLLESGTGGNDTQITGTEIRGWDHHSSQGRIVGTHPRLLEMFAYGLRSLWIALSGSAGNEPRNYASVWEDTVVVTMTEFGRTSRENGSGGTDHAEAAVVFAAGGSVQGGVYNCDAMSWGSGVGTMFESGGRYLSHASDYRAVMWEILRDHMGADPTTADAIFPGYSSLGLSEVGFIA